ncbi:hypothetical protein [Paraburkholderia solisilvae]|uniref:Uncharacterized protein n=1 Tax=Paraburkholderia solisilvae TaxID=624376 RepID=A0A6J5DBM1_9BURK|nr:hypothetical protein [Paraburkholderia solisilvae]CAB3750176.1 hypothetical protein LMG29739_00970 [Paraburkholderia solisilvae]
MKTETRKLARIATVVCGSVAPFAAHAQQAEAVAGPVTGPAAMAAAPVVYSDEESARASANLPIVDAAQSDAQCVTDAANARDVPLSYAAPIAVPAHTDTVATMSTQTAAPVFAAARANQLEWGEPRGDAVQQADLDEVPASARVASPSPSSLPPAPVEDAVRADETVDVADTLDALKAPRVAEDAQQPAPLAGAPAIPGNMLPLPDKRRPVSYAAPIAVPVHAVQAVEEVHAVEEMRAVEETHAVKEARAVEETHAMKETRAVDEAHAVEDAVAQTQHAMQPDAQRAGVIARSRLVSYAAPIEVRPRGDASARREAREAAQPLAQAQPFALTSATAPHAPASIAQASTSPTPQLLAPPSKTPRPLASPALSSQPQSSSQLASPSPTLSPRAAAAPAALPAPPAKPPVSYAAPIAAPSRANSTAATRQQQAQPALPTRAQPAATAANSEDPNWSASDKVAISDERLDKMRGGFDLSSGLKVSFGISRMVVVNGNLLTTTSFNIPDISNISAQQAQQLASVNAGALVQNGPGNVVQPGALPGVSGAVIQNTLNNQNIQALTTINTTVNSLSMFKNFNVGSTLNGALINAVRTR